MVKSSLCGWPSTTWPNPHSSTTFPSAQPCFPFLFSIVANTRMSCSGARWRRTCCPMWEVWSADSFQLSAPSRSVSGVRSHSLLGAAFIQWLSNRATEAHPFWPHSGHIWWTILAPAFRSVLMRFYKTCTVVHCLLLPNTTPPPAFTGVDP